MGRKFGWHSGKLKVKELDVDNTLSFGSLNFGAAELDTLLLNGRLATGTSASGTSLGLGATYAYGEAIELRYNVTSWTGIGSSFKALYLRSEADLGGSYGLRCAELYGVMDTSTTTGLSNLQVLYTEMLVKASASNRTLTAGNSIESNISIENQTGTLTLTNNIYCLYAKAQTGTGIADYTKVCGIKIAGRDDGTARVFGTALDIVDPEATICTWTTGISITTGCTTAISVTAAAAETVLNIDAGTTDHTGANIITADLDVNSAACKFINLDLDVGTALSTGEYVYGVYLDIAGAAGDNAGAGLWAFYGKGDVTSGAPVVGLELATAFDTGVIISAATTTGLSISGTATDGIVISGICGDAIHISGANTSSGLHISGDQVIGILYDVTAAATDGLSIAVPTEITLTRGLNMTCTGTGTITNAISLTYTASATECIAITLATGQTITTGMSLSGAGTYTTGILLDATAIGTGISITAGSLSDGIKISGITPVDGIEISSACSAVGLNVSGACLVGIDVAGSTTGIDVGSATTGINFTGAYTNGILLGTHDWGVGGAGMIELGTTKGMMEIAGKVTSSNDAAGVYMCSYEQLAITSATQNLDVSMFVSWNELYITPATTTNLTGSSHYAAVKGHVEVSGTVTSSTGVTASLWGSNIIPSGYTNNGIIAGCYVDGIIHTSMTNTGDTMAYGIGAHNDPNQGDWEYGLYMPALTVTTGIYIGSCTTGIQVTGTGAVATSKAITTTGWTINNANLTDGYGIIEAELTLTGTVAGHVSALSSWINMASVTTGGNYVCAQSNGLWSASGGILTNGVFIFGMRAQCLLQTNGGVSGAKFYPFSVVNNTNITTALFKCNAGSSDVGTTAVSKTTESKYVPLYEDDAGVHYVLIYN